MDELLVWNGHINDPAPVRHDPAPTAEAEAEHLPHAREGSREGTLAKAPSGLEPLREAD